MRFQTRQQKTKPPKQNSFCGLIADILLADTFIIAASGLFVNMKSQDCGGVKNRPVLWHGAADGHLDRRFESAEAARDLVVLLDLRRFIAFDALEATFRDVRTEFLAK